MRMRALANLARIIRADRRTPEVNDKDETN
jgi:hypothetical protein